MSQHEAIYMSLILFSICFLYIVLAPFNKVEESFHLQATHDILLWGYNISSYDHHLFPGVVPRTFIGALVLAILSLPFKILVFLTSSPKIVLQVCVRSVLGGLVCASYGRLLYCVMCAFGRRTARGMAIAVACTPHFLFYASRTLPNTFGTLLVLHGISFWIQIPRIHSLNYTSYPLIGAIACFVAATLWFRCDVLILLGSVALSWLIMQRATFLQLILYGSIIGIFVLTITVSIDSIFWKKWLWPEGVVLFFNTVANRSSEYGVSPWYWYWTSALPRAMLGTCLFVFTSLPTIAPKTTPIVNPCEEAIIGELTEREYDSISSIEETKEDGDESMIVCRTPPTHYHSVYDFFWSRYTHKTIFQILQSIRIDYDIAEFLFPGILFVSLYSFLPHKELRFLLPGLPLFQLAAGRGMTKMYRFGEALLYGISNVQPSLDAAAAELWSDAMETAYVQLFGLNKKKSIVSTSAQSNIQSTPVTESDLPSSPGILSPRLRLRQKSGVQKEKTMEKNSSNKQNGVETSSTSSTATTKALNTSNTQVPTEPFPISSSMKKIPSLSYLRMILGFLFLFVVTSILLINTLGTILFIRASIHNYPGGEALQRLYSIYSTEIHTLMKHIDTKDTTQAKLLDFPISTMNDISSTSSSYLPPCPTGDITAFWPSIEWWRICSDGRSPCSLTSYPWVPSTVPTPLTLNSTFGHIDGNFIEQIIASMTIGWPPSIYTNLTLFTTQQPIGTSTKEYDTICLPATHKKARTIHVHIDVASAESGVSRFGEAWSVAGTTHTGWIYDKDESIVHPLDFAKYDILLTEHAAKHARLFDLIDTIYSFARLDWRNLEWPFGPRVVLTPRLFILRRKQYDNIEVQRELTVYRQSKNIS